MSQNCSFSASPTLEDFFSERSALTYLLAKMSNIRSSGEIYQEEFWRINLNVLSRSYGHHSSRRRHMLHA